MNDKGLILGKFNGKRIRVNPLDDMYVNATDMAKACGRLWADYWRCQSTQDFVNELSANMGIPINELVQSKRGQHGGGTWVHRHVAIDFAQWLSPAFRVWCIQRLDDVMQTGKALTPREHSEAILYKAIGDTATAIVGIKDAVSCLTGEIITVKSDVASIAKKQTKLDETLRLVQSDVAYTKGKIDGKRKNFGDWVHQAFACVVVERFRGLCPICEQVKIAAHPWNTTESWELHHWRMKGGNSPRVAFACCRSCHGKLTADYSLHGRHESLFEMVQKWAVLPLQSNRPNFRAVQ